MHQQSLDHAITTSNLLCQLQGGHDSPKHTLREALFSASQIGAALSLCWMVHCFV